MISETLIGVVIGGLIGLAGNALNIFHTKKQKNREKKEETYLKAINITTRYYTEISKSTTSTTVRIPRELGVVYNSIKPSMTIYGTEEIYTYFTEIIMIILESKQINKEENNDEINKMLKKFGEMIIEDLSK